MTLRARAIAFRTAQLNQMLEWRDADSARVIDARRAAILRELDILEGMPEDAADSDVRKAMGL